MNGGIQTASFEQQADVYVPCLENFINYYFQLIILPRELSNFEVIERLHEVIIQCNTLPGYIKITSQVLKNWMERNIGCYKNC